jgi:hypothetical protein
MSMAVEQFKARKNNFPKYIFASRDVTYLV